MQNANQNNERNWAAASHLAAILCHVAAPIHLTVPFSNVFGPLLIWLLKKPTMPLVDNNGREAVNFNITMAIIGFIGGYIPFVGGWFGNLWALVHVLFTVLATAQAANGNAYRYPLSIRFLR